MYFLVGVTDLVTSLKIGAEERKIAKNGIQGGLMHRFSFFSTAGEFT